MYCKNCGSQIDDNAVVCPHCGVATANYNNQYSVQQQNNVNILAIIGFVLSFFVAVAGLVCSIIGYRSAPEYGGKGKSLALAGIIISTCEIALSIIAVIIYVIILVGLFSSTVNYGTYI